MKSKKWSTYIMLGNFKLYLRKHMTTTEAIKWLESKCVRENGNNFMCGFRVYCESK